MGGCGGFFLAISQNSNFQFLSVLFFWRLSQHDGSCSTDYILVILKHMCVGISTLTKLKLTSFKSIQPRVYIV